MNQIPLLSDPSQNLTVPLGGQVCQLSIYQKFYGLYMDIYVNDVLIIAGVICQNKNRIVRDAYLGFVGDLAFIDTQGDLNPFCSDLNSRYFLIYFADDAELTANGIS